MKKIIVLGLMVLGFTAIASAQTAVADQPAPEKKASCKAKASTDHADCKDKKDGEVKACCKGKAGDDHANCKDGKSGETKACCKDKKEGAASTKTGATAAPASKVARKPSETVKKSDAVTAKSK